MRERIVFIDRNGTLIKDYSDREWSEVTKIEPINKKLMKFLSESECKLVVVSNQYLVAEGYMSKQQFNKIDVQFREYLIKNGIENFEILYAMDERKENSYETKPNIGLIMKYLYDNQVNDLRNLIYIGNTDVDRDMAERLNFQFVDITSTTNELAIEQIKNIYLSC